MSKTALRLEYKYLLSLDDLDRLRRMILPYVNIDKFGRSFGREGYCVRSIYLDTPEVCCYHEKEAGIKVRRKYRIRVYNQLESDSKVFLEIKRKYINRISKNRAPVSYRDLLHIFTDHQSDTESQNLSDYCNGCPDMAQFMYHYYSRGLRPMVLINYEREAFFSRFDPGLRLTFDKNLRSSIFPNLDTLFAEMPYNYSLNNKFILEVKFYESLPNWFRSIIQSFDISRLALSKYTICLKSHKLMNCFNPRLPSGFTVREFIYPEEEKHYHV